MGWPEWVGGKGAKEMLFCIHHVLSNYATGAGWLTFSSDTAGHLWSQHALKYFTYVSSPKAPADERMFFGVSLLPYRSGHSVNLGDLIYMLVDNAEKLLGSYKWGHIDEFKAHLDHLVPALEVILIDTPMYDITKALDDSKNFTDLTRWKDKTGPFKIRDDKPLMVSTNWSVNSDGKPEFHPGQLDVTVSVDPTVAKRRIDIEKPSMKKKGWNSVFRGIEQRCKGEYRKVDANKVHCTITNIREFAPDKVSSLVPVYEDIQKKHSQPLVTKKGKPVKQRSLEDHLSELKHLEEIEALLTPEVALR